MTFHKRRETLLGLESAKGSSAGGRGKPLSRCVGTLAPLLSLSWLCWTVRVGKAISPLLGPGGITYVNAKVWLVTVDGEASTSKIMGASHLGSLMIT